MGWAWSVYLIQHAHLRLLKEIRPAEPWVIDKVPTEPISRTHMAKVLYIDNFATIGLEKDRPARITQ